MAKSDDAWGRSGGGGARPPHPATLAQPKTLQPHPATVVQKKHGLHAAVAWQRGIVQRSLLSPSFEPKAASNAARLPEVELGAHVDVYKPTNEKLMPEEGTLAAWVIADKSVFALTNAHVLGTKDGTVAPQCAYSVELYRQVGRPIGWTSTYQKITTGTNFIDAGLLWFEPGTPLKKHTLVRGPVRDLDKEPLQLDEPLYMLGGPKRDVHHRVVKAYFAGTKMTDLSFSADNTRRFKVYKLVAKGYAVSIPGESGGLWVDGAGRPTLHNNWGTSGGDADDLWFGGGMPLEGTDSTMAWLRQVLGNDVELYFGDLVAERPAGKFQLAEFDYPAWAYAEMKRAFEAVGETLKGYHKVPEDELGPLEVEYKRYQQLVPVTRTASEIRALIEAARTAMNHAKDPTLIAYELSKKQKQEAKQQQRQQQEQQGGGFGLLLPPPPSKNSKK